MTVQMLLVEDLGHRSEEFKRAVAQVNAGQPESAQIVVDAVTSVFDLDEQELLEPASLARYDAVLVDFHLNTDRLCRQFGTRAPLVDGPMGPVPVETGMGVLLWLNDRAETDEYRKERVAVTREFPSRRQRPHQLTFGSLDDVWPKFYASAGRSWFGTSHIDATNHQGTVKIVEEMRRQIVSGAECLRLATMQNQAIERALAAFEAMVEQREYAAFAKWNQGQVSGEAYDWYAMYLAFGGKRGGTAGLVREIKERWGADCTWSNLTVSFSDTIATTLQNSLEDFVIAFAPDESSRTWDAPWRQGNGSDADPMLDVLRDSALFWQSTDVRAALLAHRVRCRQSLPPPPLA